MDLSHALDFARARRNGVLATIRRDGRPQMSNILYVMDADELRISVTESRAKTVNMRRDPRAAVYVPGEDFWSYVVLDGTVSLTDTARDASDDVVEQLVQYYRDGSGEHPDWDEFRATMVREGRVLARLTPTTAYGISRD